MNKSHFRNWGKSSLLFVLLMSSACNSKREAETNIASQLKAIEEEVRQVQSKLNSSVGGELSDKLKAIRNRLSDPTADTSGVSEEFTVFRRSLSALTAIELAQPIADVDWLLQMQALLSTPQSAESLSDARSLLEEVPDSLGSEVAEIFAKRHAQELVKLGNSLAKSDATSMEAVSLIVEMLSDLTFEGTPDLRVEELRKALDTKSRELSEKALSEAVTKDTVSLDAQLATVLSISDLELRHTALASLNQNIDSLRTQLALQGHEQQLALTAASKGKISYQLDAAFEAIALRQSQKLRTARMRYQAWALAEIDKFNSLVDEEATKKELTRLRDETAKSKDPIVIRWLDFKNVRAMFEKTIGKVKDNFELSTEQQKNVGGFVKSNWNPILYQLHHDAAARHLLHIDQAMLEPPVAKFYNQAFESVWKKLEEVGGLQLSLARTTAEVPKRGLESFVKDPTK